MSRKNLKEFLYLLCTVGIVMLVYMLSGIGCPVLFLSGIPCMGCGMTRAVCAMWRLDFVTAFQYHPLCFFLPVIVIGFLLKARMPRKIYRYYVGTVILVFVIVYLVRLLNPADAIIKINLDDGFVYEIVRIIRERRI